MFSHHISPTIGASFFTCKINIEDTRIKLQVSALHMPITLAFVYLLLKAKIVFLFLKILLVCFLNPWCKMGYFCIKDMQDNMSSLLVIHNQILEVDS